MLANNSKWSGSVSRLYYAVFHAVSALLIHDGHPVKSHKGAAVLFNQYYIKTSSIAPEYGALFGRLEDMREEGDYNCHYKISPDELLSSLQPAKGYYFSNGKPWRGTCRDEHRNEDPDGGVSGCRPRQESVEKNKNTAD